jgi:hypothetical protein
METVEFRTPALAKVSLIVDLMSFDSAADIRAVASTPTVNNN